MNGADLDTTVDTLADLVHVDNVVTDEASVELLTVL